MDPGADCRAPPSPAGTSRVTTAPAPTIAPRPIVTPHMMIAPLPIEASLLDERALHHPVLTALERAVAFVARGLRSLMNITP